MIWALLEITLPLCLTFLLGLIAGWLLWRWRRRLVSQEDLNKQSQTTDPEEMESLRAQCKNALSEREELISKVASMEETIGQHKAELSKVENDHKQQTEELKSARAKLEKQPDTINFETADFGTTDQTLEIQQLSNTNKELQQKLQQSAAFEAERNTAQAQIKKLEEQLLNGQSRQETTPDESAELAGAKEKTEQLARANSELQQQLKQAENTGNERDAAIDRVKQLETRLAQNNQSDNELQESRRKQAELQQQLQQANNAASELNQAKGSISTLRTQLAEAKHQLSQQQNAGQQASGQQAAQQMAGAQSEQDKRKLQELEAENARLRQAQAQQQAKGQASSSDQQLQSARSQVTNLSAQLNQEKARTAELKKNLENQPVVKPATPVTSISVGQIKKLNNEIADKESRIEQLEKKLKNKSGKRKQKASWQKGTTKLGTPGSDHKDDLTVINGIGPAIEKVLNKQGIKSVEQLAAFKAAEVKLVDEALVDFSGRIKRDEWVPQAKAIMRNGHQPPGKTKTAQVKKSGKTKKPQKPKKARKTSWQKGKTRFGTPGSAHRDDLKVINGIGPVIEKSLNWYGIKSWEQLATLKVKEVKTIDEALDFPGRIDREQWVKQAKELVKLYPDRTTRPTRRTFLNQAAAR